MADPGSHATAPAGDVAGASQLPSVRVTDQRTRGFAPNSIETGPYRGLDALDVPATVNVITRSVLDAQADTGLFDALRNVAGVTRLQLSGLAYDNLSIRGIPLNNRTSFYINGVLPIDNNVWMPMEDKERVEVLKGASALYYGFAPPSGIVNMVTKRAGTEPVTSVSLLGDSSGSHGAHVDIGRRFGTGNPFGIRVNAMDEHIEAPVDSDRGYRKFFSAALDWRVNNTLTLQYDFEQVYSRIVEQASIVPLKPDSHGVISLPGLPDPTRMLASSTRPTKAGVNTQLLRADYALSDNWTATFTAGQTITHRDRWLALFQNYDLKTGAGTNQFNQQNGQMYENKNIRVETNGVFKTGSIGHDLTIGVVQNWLFQPEFTTRYFTAPQSLYHPVDITTLTPGGKPKAFFAQHVRNGGIYAYDRIDLTSRLQFVAGLRRSEYDMSRKGTPSNDIGKTTPSGSMSYRLTPTMSVYASYVEALESAGSAPATAANAGQIMPAVISKQEELGMRMRFASHTLMSIALFNLRQPSANTNSERIYVLDGNARYRGIEFSLQGDVTRDLSLLASAMYLDAKQLDSSDPSLVGKTPQNAAHVTASLFADYRVPMLAGLSVNGGIYYIGARAINDANQAWIGGYTLLTAGVRYATRLFGKRATFRANLENATNKRYWSAAGSGQLGVGLARTFALSSTFDL